MSHPTHRRRAAGLALALAGTALARATGAADAPSPGRADPRSVQWFRDAKFGMFVHWGVYSLHGRGEWVMNNESIPIGEYEKLPPRFNPVEFDAREWVRMVKDAGMRYITITSKHHDGFCMFDSKLTDYDIVGATPFKRDVLRELADECRRQGIRLFFYYSQLDWHHPDYFPRGGTGRKTGRPEAGDWKRYQEYYIGQVRELCTNYGEIGGLWFDGWWDRREADWGHDELYTMIHRLQPRALIGNNHHVSPFPGEDFQMFEQDLPGQNTAGFNTTHQSGLPFETCRTMNNSWGLNGNDRAHRPASELIRYLVQAAGRDANLLLNTGPLPSGRILPEHRERYLAMGEWLRANGDSIYRTRGGPFPPSSWGVSTHRGKRVYLHVLNWPAGGELELRGLTTPVVSARGFHGGRVEVLRSDGGVTLRLADEIRDPVDGIVLLELARTPERVVPAPPQPAKVGPGGATLAAASARVSGGTARYEPDKDCIGFWTQPADSVSWPVVVARAGRHPVSIAYACDRGTGGAEFEVACGGSRLSGAVAETGSWTAFTTVPLGVLELPAGETSVTVTAKRMPGFAVMNLRSVTLGPAAAA